LSFSKPLSLTSIIIIETEAGIHPWGSIYPAQLDRLAIANLQGDLTEMKSENGRSPATIRPNSEKANPSKGGDAKPWVYLLLCRTRLPGRRR
jgi:hypothetical protein